jgi:hypothetical protein
MAYVPFSSPNLTFYNVHSLSDPTGKLSNLSDEELLIVLKNRLSQAQSHGRRFQLRREIGAIQNRILHAAQNAVAPAPVNNPVPQPPNPRATQRWLVLDLFIPSARDSLSMFLAKIAVNVAVVAGGVMLGKDLMGRNPVVANTLEGATLGTLASGAAQLKEAAAPVVSAVQAVAVPVFNFAAAAIELGKKYKIIIHYLFQGHDLSWMVRHHKISETLLKFLDEYGVISVVKSNHNVVSVSIRVASAFGNFFYRFSSDPK